LATRSGEISKGVITKDREIINEVKKLISILRPIGPLTIQCIKTKEDIKFIEINPRFGGGAPISIKSGANYPLYLYKLLQGEDISYNEDYLDNLMALRFDSSIYIDNNKNIFV
jgi:carbamoyl-phosphate synthase large subunit